MLWKHLVLANRKKFSHNGFIYIWCIIYISVSYSVKKKMTLWYSIIDLKIPKWIPRIKLSAWFPTHCSMFFSFYSRPRSRMWVALCFYFGKPNASLIKSHLISIPEKQSEHLYRLISKKYRICQKSRRYTQIRRKKTVICDAASWDVNIIFQDRPLNDKI